MLNLLDDSIGEEKLSKKDAWILAGIVLSLAFLFLSGLMVKKGFISEEAGAYCLYGAIVLSLALVGLWLLGLIAKLIEKDFFSGSETVELKEEEN